MANDDEIEAMAEVCLRVHKAAQRSGSPEMIALARLLLYQLASQLGSPPTTRNGQADET